MNRRTWAQTSAAGTERSDAAFGRCPWVRPLDLPTEEERHGRLWKRLRQVQAPRDRQLLLMARHKHRAGGDTTPDRADASQLRDAIDRGRTGDKVSALDSSAAPLGTDDEAGGHPPTTNEVKMAMSQEVVSPSAPVEKNVRGRALLFAAVLVVASLGLLAAAVG